MIDSEEQQRRQQLVAEVDINTAQIEEREQGMRELESQMYVTTRGVPASIQSLKPQPSPPSHIPSHTLHRTEVNEIFKDIANIVQEQGDMLDSIEGNLTTTYDRVDSGVTQLTHASRYQVRPTRHRRPVHTPSALGVASPFPHCPSISSHHISIDLSLVCALQKKARNKAMCLLVIVVIVAGILAAVLATSLHKRKDKGG